MRTRVPLSERFLLKVRITPGCWYWECACHPDGYGVIQRGGRGEGLVRATHVAYELAYGPLPLGTEACHRCDTPPCVRPTHLFAGTRLDNVTDMHAKRRGAPLPTHCPAGHEYTAENTRFRPGGGRLCKVWRRARRRARKERTGSWQ